MFDRTMMYKELDIETAGSCNRFCPTCLRNSTPDSTEVMAGRFGKQQRMDTGTVFRIIDQAAEMGFTGIVNFSHFNEPLQDSRLGKFGKHAKSKNVFSSVGFHTNADLLTPRRAREIDGHFDYATVALYDGLDTQENRQRLQALVPNIRLIWTGGNHIVTHFSPWSSMLEDYIALARPQACQKGAQRRMIIAYNGNMALCCEDTGLFNSIGNIHDTSLSDLWYSERHMDILEHLDKPGGRERYKYCQSCPRTNEPNDGSY